MSISRFQQVIFGKGGCGYAILIGCAAIFAGGMFYNCGRANMMNGPGDRGSGNEKPAGTIAGLPVPYQNVEDAINKSETQLQQQYTSPDGSPQTVPFIAQVNAAASGILQLSAQAAFMSLAQKSGIVFDQAAADSVYKDMADEQTQRIRDMLVAQKKIGPNATLAEIDKAMQGMGQNTLSAELQGLKSQLDDALKNKNYSALATPLLIKKAAGSVKASEADAEAGFNTYDVKRIVIDKPDKSGATPLAQAQKIRDEIKGGLSFEAAIDKYSDQKPAAKGKLSDSVLHVTTSTADLYKFTDLAGKPTGYVSDPIATPTGAQIYKVVGFKTDLPKDWATKKADYLKGYVKQKASKQVEDAVVDVLRKNANWTAKGYQALFDYGLASQLPADQQLAEFKRVAEEAKAAVAKNEGYDSHAAAFARYGAFDRVWNDASSDKKALLSERIDVLNTALQGSEGYDLHKELADLYMQQKEGGNALAQLLAASRQNGNSFDVVGQGNWRDISGKLDDLIRAGLVKEADAKELRDQQAKWLAGKADYDKAAAQQKADEAARIKQQEADIKKAQEDAKKNAPASKPPVPGPVSPSNTQPLLPGGSSSSAPVVPSTSTGH